MRTFKQFIEDISGKTRDRANQFYNQAMLNKEIADVNKELGENLLRQKSGLNTKIKEMNKELKELREIRDEYTKLLFLKESEGVRVATPSKALKDQLNDLWKDKSLPLNKYNPPIQRVDGRLKWVKGWDKYPEMAWIILCELGVKMPKGEK